MTRLRVLSRAKVGALSETILRMARTWRLYGASSRNFANCSGLTAATSAVKGGSTWECARVSGAGGGRGGGAIFGAGWG